MSCNKLANRFIIFNVIFGVFWGVASSSQSKKPGDTCDSRVEKWCNFDGALSCRGSACQCADPYMHYSPEKGACLSKTWFACGNLTSFDLDLPYIECIDNADCVPIIPDKPNVLKECRCAQDFKEDEDGFCVKK